jgi:hypothetical protein
MRAFRLCRGQLERLKPRKKISKIGLSGMEDTPGCQLLAEEEIAAVILLSTLLILLKFSFICDLKYIFLGLPFHLLI